jgi:hypothetical protein
MTYTIYVCPECARESQADGLCHHHDPWLRCEPVEVVPRELADDLAFTLGRIADSTTGVTADAARIVLERHGYRDAN